MSRRHIFSRIRAAVIAASFPLAIAACGDTIKNYSQTPPPPEEPAPNYNLADDGQAFSNSGQSVAASNVQTFWNVSNGTAVHLFTTQTSSSGIYLLYASFFDGTNFTPPVQIRGQTEDPTSDIDGLKVIFLNTSAYSGATSAETTAVRARNGDAIILFTRQDIDAPTGEEDGNTRLYGTYFDRSAAAVPLSGTVAYGFETLATTIDYNHVRTGNSDPDVGSFGFVTDSLHGSHTFTSSTDGVDSGDATTFVQIVWRKQPRDGSASTGNRFYYKPFDLTQTGNALPVQASAGENMLSPPAAAGSFDTNGDDVDSSFVVHNGYLIWRVQNLGATSDDVVTTSIFTGAGAPTDVLLGSNVTGQTDTTDLPSSENVYGSDHGLTSLYAFFTEDGFSNNSNTNRANDRDVMLAKIDNGLTARELQEIDAHTGLVDTTDVDGDGFRIRKGDDGGVSSGSIRTRINRTGTFITALWLQKTTDITDLNDSNSNIEDPEKNYALWAQVIQTRRNATARTIANSLLATALKSPEIDSSGDTNQSGQQQEDVSNTSFQAELPWGRSYSNSGGGGYPDLGTAIQSNNLRLNWTYQQLVDQSLSDNDDDRLLVNGLTVTLDATGTAQPTALLASATQVLVSAGFDTDYSGSYSAISVDRGNAAGDVDVYFFNNGNNPLNDGAGGAFEELRFYVYNGTSTQLLSIDGSSDLNQAESLLTAVTTPSNLDITANPNWGGTRTHVFWTEFVSSTDGASRLATRSFGKTLASPAFIPAVGQAPAFIDNPGDGDLGIEVVTVLAQGSTIGVFFDENGHLYYNETPAAADAYFVTDGASDPMLLDIEDPWALSSALVIAPPRRDNLAGSIAAWSKVDPAGDERVSLIIHQ